MKVISASLLVLSLSLGTFGSRILERSKFAANDRCPSAKEVTSSTFTVNGHDIVRQTFSCPEGSLAAGSAPSGNGETFTSGALEKRNMHPEALYNRNAAECHSPQASCECGVSFVCECQNVTANAPNLNDCKTLINSLSVVSQTEGPTFIVQPDNFELVSFQTCAFEFTSFAEDAIEYCWDELASTGSLVNQVCFEQSGGGTASACNSNDNNWLSQVLRVGS